jgi:hypothetical protein
MTNEPSGSVVPLPCQHSRGVWPSCYGYIRGRNPSQEEILWMRANMTHYCESNNLHLARIFHDWNVEPNNVNYLGREHAIVHAAQPDTHTLLLGDVDFVREPSPTLAVLTEAILQTLPDLYVCCLVDERAFRRSRG